MSFEYGRKTEWRDSLQHGDALNRHDLSKNDVAVLEGRGGRALAHGELRTREHVSRRKPNTGSTVENFMKAKRRIQARLQIALQERIESGGSASEICTRRLYTVQRSLLDLVPLVRSRRPLVK